MSDRSGLGVLDLVSGREPLKVIDQGRDVIWVLPEDGFSGHSLG